MSAPEHVVTVGLQSPLLQQLPLGMQPPLQSFCVPVQVKQLFPELLFPLSTHVDAPVAHEVVPVLQGLEGWQPTLGVQVPHVPE